VSEGLIRANDAPRACPSCRETMDREVFDRKMGGAVALDICFACHAIWFDPFESAQLTPGAVLKLFEEIHQKRDATGRPLAETCRCPVCRHALVLTHDMERTNRITYYRCPAGHGRLTTFVQFLNEKNFVRSLSPVEIEKLKAVVKQVRCTSCGAPIDLARDAQCSYCHAPIAILDAEAVQRTIAELSDQERARRTVNPTVAVDALLAGQRYTRGNDAAASLSTSQVVDLVGEALDFLMHR
jgi:Transcription factor zinc-finger